MNANKRLDQLDSIRFVSILIIVLSHFEFIGNSFIGEFYTNFLHNPTFGVDYFFVLSGFGLYLSFSEKNISNSLKDSISFAIKKIKKTYYVYLFSLIISIPCNLIWISPGHIRTVLIRFLIDLTLVQSIFGSTLFSHSINQVCWFLSTLFICYCFIPIIINIVRRYCISIKKIIIHLCIIICALLFFSYFFIKIEEKMANVFTYHETPIIDDLVYGSPYIRIFYITIGVLLGKLFFQVRDKYSKDLTVLEIIITIISILYFFLRNTINIHFIIKRLFDVINVSTVLFIFALGWGKVSNLILKAKFLSYLGTAYGNYIFLIHYPVKMSVDALIQSIPLVQSKFIFIYEIVVICILTIVFIYISKLMKKWLIK